MNNSPDYTINILYINKTKKYSQRVDDHYEHTQRLFNDILKKYGELLSHAEQCIGGDEPYIIATLCIDGKIQKRKFK